MVLKNTERKFWTSINLLLFKKRERERERKENEKFYLAIKMQLIAKMNKKNNF